MVNLSPWKLTVRLTSGASITLHGVFIQKMIASWEKTMLLSILASPPLPTSLIAILPTRLMPPTLLLTLLSWTVSMHPLDSEWWFGLAWHVISHGLRAMDEAISVNTHLLFIYLKLVLILLYYLRSEGYLFLSKVDYIVQRKSSHVCYHKGYHPKVWYRYHCFKAGVKGKKQQRFQKP